MARQSKSKVGRLLDMPSGRQAVVVDEIRRAAEVETLLEYVVDGAGVGDHLVVCDRFLANLCGQPA